MEKVLNQEEIDKLFQAAQKGQLPGGNLRKTTKEVTRFNAREAGQISKDQARSLSNLHESFARNLSNSLGAYLRVAFDVNLVSVEQLNYSEVISRIPELTYLCSVRVRRLEGIALLQMDLPLVFSVMDLVLGGNGTSTIEPRDLTEIEGQIFETVVKIIIRELETVWAPILEVTLEFDQQQQGMKASSLMQPAERTLALSFEIKMPDCQGLLNLTLPAVASNALFRKLSAQSSYYRSASVSAHKDQLGTMMLGAEFPVELRLSATPVLISKLMSLEPGHVLPLLHEIARPAILSVGGSEMYLAYPVACGSLRGSRIVQKILIPSAVRKNSE